MIRTNIVTGLVISALFFFSVSSLLAQVSEDPKITSEISGNFKLDARWFPDKALYPGQHETYFSGYFQPEIYIEWNKGNQLLQFSGFGRIDQFDTSSTHADLRELYWQIIFKKWEFSLGFKKIFWGVTESNHLVDVINQSDGLEGFDLEQKLGQAMAHASFSPKWGTIDLMAMTYHRQLRFPGPAGRPRPPSVLDYDATTYESKHKRYHPDVAVRYSNSFGILDVGLSHFYGTTRIPLFQTNDGMTFFSHYELMHQTGLEVQALTGSMLWKLEAIYRQSKRKIIRAYTIGGEYTFSNMFRSGADLGLILEYTYDDRGIESLNSLDDDLFFGLRLAANDRQSTDFLGGVIMDLNNQTIRYIFEANRRLGQSWKITVEGAGFANVDESEFIYLIRNDSFLKGSLAFFF